LLLCSLLFLDRVAGPIGGAGRVAGGGGGFGTGGVCLRCEWGRVSGGSHAAWRWGAYLADLWWWWWGCGAGGVSGTGGLLMLQMG
jgi:hypothetical protein